MKNWEKVTRWAGMGNNGRVARGAEARDGETGEMMADDVKDRLDAEQGVSRVEAGTEGGKEEELSDAAGGADGSAEVTQLRAEKDQLVDRLARLQAEFDNARKREEKTRGEARANAIGDAVEPFLGVMDNFGLALKAQGSVEQLRGGVELIVKQMEEALRGLNVVPVETVGSVFDPRVHEALGSIETAEHPDHTVLEEIRKGYRIREKLLRPALVRIAVNKAQTEA